VVEVEINYLMSKSIGLDKSPTTEHYNPLKRKKKKDDF